MLWPKTRIDDIVLWDELKPELVGCYANAYSHVMSRQPGLSHYYIEAFSRPPRMLPEHFEGFVPETVLRATDARPPFRQYFIIDLDGGPATGLRETFGEDPNVTLIEGDQNERLLRDVLPQVRTEDYRRALCVLDPAGIDLDWRVIETAGRLRTIDLFVRLPVTEAGGVPLWTDTNNRDAARLNRVWGDDSWREFAETAAKWHANGPAGAEAARAGVAAAFARRLRDVARFANVLAPLPVRHDDWASVSYLFFASRANTANHVIDEIFAINRG